MIATLRGKVLSTTISGLVIDVNGVGYAVSCTPAIRSSVNIGTDLFLHTTLVVREDAFTLFGYESSMERDLFELLQTVSGIGPKVAHSILSTLAPDELSSAISSGDSKSLERVSGLGKKGAQRIILELKEKISEYQLTKSVKAAKGSAESLSLAQALTGLGFTAREIDYALDIVKESKVNSIEEGLKIALSALQGGASRG